MAKAPRKLRLATCQFPVTSDAARNAERVKGQIAEAVAGGAHLVHFPESALSGYPGADLESWDGYDWDLLKSETKGVCRAARDAGVWVVVGSAHPLSAGHRPHNSLTVIDPRGRIVDRYDKTFCTKTDLKHYSTGDHLTTFDVRGVRVGLLICYDVRFPELYRAYQRLGVRLMLHSFYNARKKGPTVHTEIMPASARCHAASNFMWVSANNASGYYQLWESRLIQPDGMIAGKLRRHRAGVMVHEIDLSRPFYDASGPFRDRAMAGILHSGEPVDDPRSRDRRIL